MKNKNKGLLEVVTTHLSTQKHPKVAAAYLTIIYSNPLPYFQLYTRAQIILYTVLSFICYVIHA